MSEPKQQLLNRVMVLLLFNVGVTDDCVDIDTVASVYIVEAFVAAAVYVDDHVCCSRISDSWLLFVA